MANGFWRWFDRGARVDFGRTIVSALLDVRTWLSSAGGGVLSMSTAAYDGWSVTACLFAFAAGVGLFALLAAGVLTFWRARTLRIGGASGSGLVDGWKAPLDAIEAFADRSLIGIKDKWNEKFSDTHQRKYESEQKIEVLSKSTDPERENKLGHQRRVNQAATIGNQLAESEVRSAWADLRADIAKRLESGELVAKGIPAPYAAGKGEIEIAPHEWRLLAINPSEMAEALEKGSGRCRYVGVVIGKRRP